MLIKNVLYLYLYNNSIQGSTIPGGNIFRIDIMLTQTYKFGLRLAFGLNS